MRLSNRALAAIDVALRQCLAGEVLDGYDDGSDEESSMRDDMEKVRRTIAVEIRRRRTVREKATTPRDEHGR